MKRLILICMLVACSKETVEPEVNTELGYITYEIEGEELSLHATFSDPNGGGLTAEIYGEKWQHRFKWNGYRELNRIDLSANLPQEFDFRIFKDGSLFQSYYLKGAEIDTTIEVFFEPL